MLDVSMKWLIVLGGLVSLVGCGSTASSTAGGAGTRADIGGAGGADAGSGAAGIALGGASGGVAGMAGTNAPGGSGGGGATAASTVQFRYRPAWPGVTAVSVIGAFGKPDDWQAPLLTLTRDAQGTFSGSADVPAGSYPYLFQVTGDSDAKTPTTQKHLAIDPSSSAFMACPAASPSASLMAANPCSLLSAPQPASSGLFHVRGEVQLDAAPAQSWLVQLDRDEPSSHHYFANRSDTGVDGKYDFAVAPGSYRLQIFPPDGERVTDAARTPLITPYVRRGLSSAFKVQADVALDPAELSFHDYAKMSPADGKPSALPITFSFTLPGGAVLVRASMYAPSMLASDPWWDTPYGTTTTASFDGTFNTNKASEPMATAGKGYWWGVWANSAPGAAGVVWTRQSMILPVAVK